MPVTPPRPRHRQALDNDLYRRSSPLPWQEGVAPISPQPANLVDAETPVKLHVKHLINSVVDCSLDPAVNIPAGLVQATISRSAPHQLRPQVLTNFVSVQVPKLRQAATQARSIMTENDRRSVVQVKCRQQGKHLLQFLNTEWNGSGWLPQDIRDSRRTNKKPIRLSVLKCMKTVTSLARSQNIPLETLWADGGLLREALGDSRLTDKILSNLIRALRPPITPETSPFGNGLEACQQQRTLGDDASSQDELFHGDANSNASDEADSRSDSDANDNGIIFDQLGNDGIESDDDESENGGLLNDVDTHVDTPVLATIEAGVLGDQQVRLPSTPRELDPEESRRARPSTQSPSDFVVDLSILQGSSDASRQSKTNQLGAILNGAADSLFETPTRKRPRDSSDMVLELSDSGDGPPFVSQSQNAHTIAKDVASKVLAQLSSDARLTDSTMWLLCEVLQATEAGPGSHVSDALWLDPEDAPALHKKSPDRQFRRGTMIYTPMHHSHSEHWSLCIFRVNLSAVDVEFVDSALDHQRVQRVHQNLSTWLSVRGGSRKLASFTALPSPQQKDATNCGVHVLHCIRQLLADKPLNDEAINPQETRQGLLRLIQKFAGHDRLPQTAAMAVAEIQLPELFRNPLTTPASSAIIRSRVDPSKNRLALLNAEPDTIKARLSLLSGARVKAEEHLEQAQSASIRASEAAEKASGRRETFVLAKEGQRTKARDAYTQAVSSLKPRLTEALVADNGLLAGFLQTSIDVLSGQMCKFEADLETEDEATKADYEAASSASQRTSDAVKQHKQLLDRLLEDELQLQKVLGVLVQIQSIGDVDISGLLARTEKDV